MDEERVLVYQKNPANGRRNPKRFDRLKTHGSSERRSSSNSCVSRTPSLEDLSSIESRHGRRAEKVGTSFKVEWMMNTLEFVNDCKATTLRYPKMKEGQASFLYTMNKNCTCQQVKDMCPEARTLYAPLLEAAEVASLKHDFKIFYDDKSTKRRKFLVLEKLPKNKPKIASQDCRLDHSQCDSVNCSLDGYNDRRGDRSSSRSEGTADERVTGVDTELSRRQRNYKAIFDSCTVPYIASAMQRVTDFVQDDSRNTLEFQDSTVEEACFLKSLSVFPYKEALANLLPNECQSLVRDLRRALTGCKLRVTEQRGGDRRKARRGRLRDVLIYKSSGKSNNRNVSRYIERKVQDISRNKNEKPRNSNENQRGGNENHRNSTTSDEYDPRAMFLNALSSKNRNGRDVSAKRESSRSKEKNRSKNSRESSTGDKYDGNDLNASYDRQDGIKWQRAGNVARVSQAEAGAPAAASSGTGSGVGGRGRPGTRSKLALALAVPIDCDKASRMMRMMGWNGGALGLRGEGITEPIMPALDLVSGAGLGHSPTRGKRNNETQRRDRGGKGGGSVKSSHEFRLRFLLALLDLLREPDLMERKVLFRSDVTKREAKFVRTALRDLNRRTPLGLADADEKDAVTKILATLNSQKDVFVEMAVSNDSRTLTLRKTHKAPQYVQKRRKASAERRDPSPEGLQIVLEPPDDKTHTTVRVANQDFETIRGGQGSCKKSAINLAHRVIFLQNLLSFLKSKDSRRTVTFDYEVLDPQFSMLEMLVDKLNKREKASYGSKTETEIYAAALRKIDCFLKISCSVSKRRFTVQKLYYEKRFTNSSLTPKQKEKKVDTDMKEEKIPLKDLNVPLDHLLDMHVMSESENSLCYDIELFDDDDLVDIDSDEAIDNNKDKSTAKFKDTKDDIEIWNSNSYEKAKTESNVNISDKTNINNETTNKMDIQEGTDDEELIDSDSVVDTSDDGSVIVCVDSSHDSDSNNASSRDVECKSVISKEAVGNSLGIKISEIRTIVTDAVDIQNNNTELNINIKLDDVVKNDGIKSISEGKIDAIDLTESSTNDDVLQIDNVIVKSETNEECSNPSPGSSKRSRSNSENSECQLPKRLKTQTYMSDVKNVVIAPKEYPSENLVLEDVKFIQQQISKNIDTAKDLPLLKCNGLSEGRLKYSCFDHNSCDWLQDLIKKISSDLVLSVTAATVNACKYKIALKINSFIEVNTVKLFERIKLYNPNLNTDRWEEIERNVNETCVVLILEIDEESYKCIAESNFNIYVGIDKAECSVVFN